MKTNTYEPLAANFPEFNSYQIDQLREAIKRIKKNPHLPKTPNAVC